MLVVSLGDLVLDVVVRLRQPLARGADAAAAIDLSTGGQGANVAAWIAALGGRARWLGKRADDDRGRLAAATLERLGVELVGPVTDRGGGVIVSLVDPDGERSMCPDRGVGPSLRPDELAPAWLECDHLHVSGYALFQSPLRETAIEAVRLARAGGARVSIDLSSWSGIRDAGAESLRRVIVGLDIDTVFANEAELDTIGGAWKGPYWIVKRGARGCTFGEDDRAALPARVVDTTGAGDALAAGWLVGGPDLALESAARCVERVGSMPPV
jgi:sugar/nucleoside kinase (ribokinase family)